MLIPGIGETYVTSTIRLVLALAISLIMMPVISPTLPTVLPNSTLSLFTLLFAEIMVGLFIGSMVRLMLSLMHVAGMVIAFQSSLASALLFDVNQGNQGSVVGGFMTLLAVTVIFTSNLHHLIFIGFTQSYDLFKVGVFPDTANFSDMATKMVSDGFNVGVKIAAPVLVVTLLLYLAAGIMSRLMPSMQIFFVMVPAQIFITFFIMMITLSTGMMLYLEYYHSAISFMDSTK